MRRSKKLLIFLLSVSLLNIADSKAQSVSQLVVTKIPASPQKVKRFAKPTKYHIWVTDEWAVGNKQYVFTPGHWGIPPTNNTVWIPGSWRKQPKGYVWVTGYWKSLPKSARKKA